MPVLALLALVALLPLSWQLAPIPTALVVAALISGTAAVVVFSAPRTSRSARASRAKRSRPSTSTTTPDQCHAPMHWSDGTAPLVSGRDDVRSSCVRDGLVGHLDVFATRDRLAGR